MHRFSIRFLIFAISVSCFTLTGQLPSAADQPAKTVTKTQSQSSGPRPENVIRDSAVTVKTNTREFTVEGEVVDTWCYTSGVMGEGRGEKHKSCGRKCVGGGVTAGILADDGTLYIAAKHQAYNGCAGLLLPYVAMRVKVKGWLAEKGGCKLLKINSVEPVKVSSSKTSTTNTKRP
jgi:hypothetical protein